MSSPVKLALAIRWPAWTSAPLTIRINDRRRKINGQPGSYITLDREWHDGDRVTIQLPMKLDTEALPGTTNAIALLFGPIVLAGELGQMRCPPRYTPGNRPNF